MPKRRWYTSEETQYILDNHEKYDSVQELTDAMNAHFGTDFNYNQIHHKLHRCGIRRKPNSHKAHEAVRREIGYTRPGSRGEQFVKTESGKIVRDYIKIWEDNHGKVPDGYAIIHLDKDISNNNLDNLACVPRGYIMTLCQYGWYSKNPEITKAGIEWLNLRKAIKDKL